MFDTYQHMRFQIGQYQRQIDTALSAYSASRDQTSLRTALKAQAQLVDVLLKLTNLSDASSTTQLARIQCL
jgi:hypothetical protein